MDLWDLLSLLLDTFIEWVVDPFLQNPIICSSLVTCVTLLFLPLDCFGGGRWEWIALCHVIVVLLVILVSIIVIPVLNIAPSYLILRPKSSCSTHDNPVRYICVTLKDHQPVFYVTTKLPIPNSLDAVNMNNATKYYIISSWIPPADGDHVTIEPVQFQSENLPGKNKRLPKHFGVLCQPAEQSGGDRQIRVTYNCISSTGEQIPYSGFIDSNLLREFESGWYRVSNCRCKLTRWWYSRRGSHHEGYVNSYYVRLPYYTRYFLRENKKSTHAP